MTRPSKVVFLSYAHADEETVARVYQHLRAAGFDPWMDKFSLPPGAKWRNEIDKAIRRSGAFLSLISGSSVDRGGILRGEMKLALDLRSERLDDGGILIPVRLEDCRLPDELGDTQALDWFASDGPAKLTNALAGLLKQPSGWERIHELLRRKWALAIVALICFSAGLGVYRAVSLAASLRVYETFLRSRPGSPVPASSGARPQIGVTLWRVTEDNASGSGTCGFLRFTRKALSEPVRAGERLRLDVQASREGYIYVISREINQAGSATASKLIFPISTINGGNNRIVPGNALMIPPASDVCNTLQLTHAGDAEQISVVFSDKPLDALQAREEPYPIEPAIETMIEASGILGAATDAPGVRAMRSVPLPDSESRDLNYTSSGPDAVFTSSGTAMRPIIARFVLKTLK